MVNQNHYLSASDITRLPEIHDKHQFNENAVRVTRRLSDGTGLQRLGIHLVRLQPGKESTQFHTHDANEEFLYILEGEGVADIGEQTINVGRGDFMGFPTGSSAHTMRNESDSDLVYLMGGERNLPDVVHYPRINRSMIKSEHTRKYIDWDALHDIGPGR